MNTFGKNTSNNFRDPTFLQSISGNVFLEIYFQTYLWKYISKSLQICIARSFFGNTCKRYSQEFISGNICTEVYLQKSMFGNVCSVISFWKHISRHRFPGNMFRPTFKHVRAPKVVRNYFFEFVKVSVWEIKIIVLIFLVHQVPSISSDFHRLPSIVIDVH